MAELRSACPACSASHSSWAFRRHQASTLPRHAGEARNAALLSGSIKSSGVGGHGIAGSSGAPSGGAPFFSETPSGGSFHMRPATNFAGIGMNRVPSRQRSDAFHAESRSITNSGAGSSPASAARFHSSSAAGRFPCLGYAS